MLQIDEEEQEEEPEKPEESEDTDDWEEFSLFMPGKTKADIMYHYDQCNCILDIIPNLAAA